MFEIVVEINKPVNAVFTYHNREYRRLFGAPQTDIRRMQSR